MATRSLLDVFQQVLHQLLLCCLLPACLCQFSNNLVKVSLQLVELLVNFLLLRRKDGHVLWKITSLSSHRVRLHGFSLDIIQEIMTSSQKLLVGKFPNLILGQSAMASWRLVDFVEAIPIRKKRIYQLLCYTIAKMLGIVLWGAGDRFGGNLILPQAVSHSISAKAEGHHTC